LLKEVLMINWTFFPRSDRPPQLAREIIQAFEQSIGDIDSATHDLGSDDVLAVLRPRLELLGFRVETSKLHADKIRVPVLFGRNGVLEKSFDADAYHEAAGFVIEIEAGRGVTNNQFLKDLFQACMMHDVMYLAIAVRNTYKKRKDFEIVERFFNTLYIGRRLQLPLKGLLLIGY
jgi:hypothetical protein